MSEFLQRLENAAQQRHLFSPAQKILVAVSGGVDSMVLLHVLHSLSKKNRWKIIIAHFNHHLRGRASNADEQLVRKTAAELRLKFISAGADVKNVAAQSKLSIEMAARKLRHEFLAGTAHKAGASTIALAHHADDQVELFFLRLFRGAGSESLAGMKWRSPSPADKSIALVRPLLDSSKAELLAFARENKIRFRHDATNFSTDFLRNRVRNELLPLLLKKYQPGLDKTVLRLMDILSAEAEFVSATARSGDGSSPVGNFNARPLAIQRKVLQQQLTALGLVPDFELIEELRKSPGKAVSVCAGLTVARDTAGKVSCHEYISSGFNSGEVHVNISGKQGRAELNGRTFQWRIEPMKEFRLPQSRPAGTGALLREFFDAGKVGNKIVLRHWRPGDRFQPIGLRSAVKLQDLFVNAKIPSTRRRELALATTHTGEIFWVEGLRIGEQFKLTSATRQKFSWQQQLGD